MYETSQTDKVLTIKRYNKKMGRKTELNDEMFLKIKDLILQNKNLKQIAKEINIPMKTVYDWRAKNYQQFQERCDEYARDRKLAKAEAVIEVLLNDKQSNIKLDSAKFLLETLGKKSYSKKEANINIINMPTPILGNMLDDMARVNVIEHESKD